MSEKASTNTLLNFLSGEWKRMDDDHQARAKAFVKWYKQFRGIHEDRVVSSLKSRLFLNRTKVVCIAGVANVLDVLIPSEDFFEVVGRNMEADTPGAELTKGVTSWALRAGDFYNESVRYVLQAAIMGTTFGKIVPREVVERTLTKEPQMIGEGVEVQEGVKTGEKEERVLFSEIQTVDVFDIRVDPEGLDVDREKSSGLFHLVSRRLSHLRAQEKAGHYTDIDEVAKLVEKAKAKKESGGRDQRRKVVGLPEQELHGEAVYLKEYWGVVPADIAKANKINVKDGEFEVESIITVAGVERDKLGTIIIRAERNNWPNQMRMFVRDVWEPSGERSMWGRGIPENVRGSQQALNVTVNLRLDNQAWAIAAPLVVNLDKLEDQTGGDLVAKVNWVIRGRGASPSDIAQFVQVPNITGSSTAEAQEFERHIEDESGINKQVQATESFGSNRTYGGISLAYSAAARPVRLIARGLETNLVAKGIKKLFISLAVRLSDTMKIRITDDPRASKYLEVDPLKLALDVDFLASGSFALLQREQLTQNILSFLEFLSKVPQLAQRPEWQWKAIAQDYYQAAGLKGFERWWKEGAMPMTPAAPEQGGEPAGAGAGGIPPELAAALGGQGAETSGIAGGGAEGGAEGDRVLELLARVGQAASGGQGAPLA